MKNISLKKLMLALLLTAAVPTLTAQVHVGDILCEGNAIISPANYPSSGATAIGVVFYVDQTGQHGWAVALQDAGNTIWSSYGGSYGSDTPLPNYGNTRQAIQDLDGYNNTLIVRQHSTDHPAFYAVDFENGWYVPAIGQLNYLYGNMIEVNAGLTMAGGFVFTSMSNWQYWSSTEIDGNKAWALTSSGDLTGGGNGNPGWYNGNKRDYRYVRAVRNF